MSTADGGTTTNNGPKSQGRGPSPSSPAPSLMKQFFDLRTALVANLKHPAEVGRMVGANVQQFGAKLAGTEFKPDRDIGSQEGKVIFVTGGT